MIDDDSGALLIVVFFKVLAVDDLSRRVTHSIVSLHSSCSRRLSFSSSIAINPYATDSC